MKSEKHSCILIIIRPHRSTMYIDAAYCYRPSSVVCQSVCHTSEPCKNGWTNQDAVWFENSGGPRKLCIRWGPDTPWEGTIFGGRSVPLQSIGTPVQKRFNQSRCRFWLWAPIGQGIINYMGVQVPHGKGQFWGKGVPIVKYKEFLP